VSDQRERTGGENGEESDRAPVSDQRERTGGENGEEDDADAGGSEDRTEATDLHSIGTGRRRAFWADAVADEVEARDPDEPIVVKGGVSPSGVPHIGHLNEIMRGYFVAEALRQRGYEVRQVFTSDDRDPLRKVPRRLADADWQIVELGELPDPGALGRNLGRPLTDVPDPFDCHDSFGAHQTALLEDMADRMGVEVEVLSNTQLYAEGAFEDVTRRLLADRERAREVLSAYQSKVDEQYVPFNPVCSSCGHLTETVTAVDLTAGTVEYVCEDITAGDRTIEGCGHEGTATLREGKLPWRFEWPAQWEILGVDFEPFGKDHAEGSWPSGEDVARNVLGIEPPVPMVYEWFTYDGEALSSSSGHFLTVAEVLEMIEVEVFGFFFTKNPKRARDFDVRRLDQLVDEFDRFERAYFGEAGSEEERARAERAYPVCVDGICEERVRIPYTFAAVLGMTDDPDLRETMARRSGPVPEDAPAWAVEEALERVEGARTWAVRTDNEYNYRLAEALPDVDPSPEEASALDALAAFVETDPDAGELPEEIYEIARDHDVPVGDFFALGYRLFLGQEEGPRLGPFLQALDREFVLKRLRREG
jgi:lysyl-tRNA synthetase class 1